MSAPPSLDALLARARAAEVRPELAAAAIAEVERAARARAAVPAWSWRRVLAGAGLAVAAAALLVGAWPRGGGPGPAVVRIGSRVAIVVEPGARFDVAAAGGDRTAIVVERGTVTARLWPGHAPHRLTLRGADVVATATGTVYTLAVGAGGAIVRVHEGTVEIVTPDGARAIGAGAWWPADAAGGAVGAAAASRLDALATPEPIADLPVAVPSDAVDAGADRIDAALDAVAEVVDAGVAAASGSAIDRAVGAPLDAAAAADAGGADAAPSLVDQWRRARQLRAQGNARGAAAVCLAIADAADPTWSPIALVEAIRIQLDLLSAPEQALAIADRMIARWPAHPLEGETRALRCRALRQLGRGAECAADELPVEAATDARSAGAPPADARPADARPAGR